MPESTTIEQLEHEVESARRYLNRCNAALLYGESRYSIAKKALCAAELALASARAGITEDVFYTEDETAAQILADIGYRAWINQPSETQRLHRHHGKRGIVIPMGDNRSVFFFMPRKRGYGAAVSVSVSPTEITTTC